jgi:hypothetical protein
MPMSKRQRRVDDRIRELSARVVAPKDAEELSVILPELQSAISQAVQRLRTRAVAILGPSNDVPSERRKTCL